MPIYEYQCESCGERSEVMQRMSDPPLETCETCGGKLKKLISAPAFQFKGSGWYVTDYARKGDAGKEGSNGSSQGDSSDSSKSSESAPSTSASDSSSSSKDSSSKSKTEQSSSTGG